MRFLGLSCRLPDTICRNISYREPSDLTDAGVILWSPASSIAEYRTQFEKLGDDGAPPLLTLAGTEAFLVDERRRRDALNGLLRRGGVVIVDLAGDARVRIHTVEQIFTVDLAASLPHPGASVIDALAGPPADAEVTAGEPFRAFAATAFDPARTQIALSGHPGNPLVKAATGETLGFYAGIGAGYLVALPIGADDTGPDDTDRLVAAIGALAGAVGRVRHGLLPPWVDDVLPPEEAALRDDSARLAGEMDRLRERARALAMERERLRARRELIFARGRLLAEAVAEAFRSSGASVFQGRDDESDLVVERGAEIYVVDIHDDTRDDSAGRIAHIAAVAARESGRAGRTAQAVLVDAREQMTAPADRANPAFDPRTLEAARASRVTLLTTAELFALARRAADLPGDPWADWLTDAPRPAALPEMG